MASSSVLQHLARGIFTFLRPDMAEMRRVFPQAEDILPVPQRIFLEDIEATPLVGFPVLLGPSLRQIDEALAAYLRSETEAQAAVFSRQPFDSKLYAQNWERYRGLLARVLENTIASSRGSAHTAIFWLHHSQEVASQLLEIPRELRRTNLAVGREHGDAVKFRVFSKWIDRVVALNYDVAHRLATTLEEEEAKLFPALLAHMRDNVLIFTQDYVSPDLSELGSYFQGCLGRDGRDFRQRMARLGEWHSKVLRTDPLLAGAAQHFLGGDPGDPDELLRRSGYLSFLSHHVTFSSTELLSAEQIQLWESLLEKLKEFEILRALRKMIVLLETEEDGELVCRDRSMNTTWVGGPSVLRVSNTTRPMDFTAPWVVDPVVQRCGLVYDITDFSTILSHLGRAEKSALDEAFRMTSRFQRSIDKTASSLELKLEKYLGDGAFYSGRNAQRMTLVALHIQRLYPTFVDQGFPFSKGLRIALNYGEYRLLPLDDEGGQQRYEYFGHGLVELSRLSTGKRTHEIEDIKTYLINQGYQEQTVNKFFAPILRRNAELVSKLDEARRFYAYINPNGSLINEGIVATESFIRRLGIFRELRYTKESGRWFVALELDVEGHDRQWIGLRKLGIGRFKGLDPVPVYEIIDGGHWTPETLREIPAQHLMGALEKLFAQTVTHRQGPPAERGPMPSS